MSSRPAPDVVVMGASAGGVEALATVVDGLPPDLPAAVFVVLHISSASVLPAILARRARLPVRAAVHGERVEPGRVYVAPPDVHLKLVDGHVALDRGPRENRHRPAVDVLFRSAAEAYAERVLGVVLSGTLDDGSAGLRAIKASGGVALVQDPEQAMYPGMPASAIATVAVDAILDLQAIPAAICEYVDGPRSGPEGGPSMSETRATSGPAEPDEPTPPSADTRVYACPDCGGVLQETQELGMVRFECHTGHVYSPESLIAAQADEVEGAMWSAVRSLRERAALLRRTARRFASHNARSRASLERQADEALRQADLIRAAIVQMRPAEETVDA